MCDGHQVAIREELKMILQGMVCCTPFLICFHFHNTGRHQGKKCGGDNVSHPAKKDQEGLFRFWSFVSPRHLSSPGLRTVRVSDETTTLRALSKPMLPSSANRGKWVDVPQAKSKRKRRKSFFGFAIQNKTKKKRITTQFWLIICVVIDTPLALPRGPRGPFCPGDTQADETLTVFPSGAVRTLDKSTWAASTVRRCPAQKYLNPIQPKTQSAGSCFSFHERKGPFVSVLGL
jgi:hypothetical protein